MPLMNRPYQGAYRSELEDEPVTQDAEPGSHDTDTSTNGPELTPDEANWRKRYGDLRTHSNSLTQRISVLERQLLDSNRKEVRIPSSPEEIQGFANQYPDTYRHILTIARTELLRERDDIVKETRSVQEDLDAIKKERGLQKIHSKHSDFDDLLVSQNFHDWAQVQPKQIQDFLFESDDPDLCIKAIDMYKAETNYKKAKAPSRQGADLMVPNRGTVDVEPSGNKRIWKDSEIRKLHPRDFDKFEAEIDAARREGRYDATA